MIPNLKIKNIQPPEPLASLLRFEVWYDRDDPRSYRNIPELESYMDEKQWITLTQAPSMGTLRSSPMTFLRKEKSLFVELGFKPRPTEPESDVNVLLETSGESDEILPVELADWAGKDWADDGSSEGTDISEKKLVAGLSRETAFDYSDPWKIFAARELCSIRAVKPPDLTVWYADLHRLADPIPPECLGKGFQEGLKTKGKRTRPLRFQDIKSMEVVFHLISRHTHWGHCLWNMVLSKDKRISRWARCLKRRVVAFLNGKPDPLWSEEQVNLYYTSMRDRKYSERASRFLELLKTVSGIFIQRYLVSPEEVWTWEKFDLFNLKNLSFLLSDEFFDGECSKEILNVKTFYKSLKTVRKTFKWIALNDLPIEQVEAEVPTWLKSVLPQWRAVLERVPSEHRVYQIGILSQSRGVGTPPMIDVLVSKRKFVETVTIPAPDVPSWKKGLIRSGLLQIMKDIPDHVFTGISNKAIVTVTTSACRELKVADGGTTQAIADELGALPPGRRVPIRDLHTGKITSYAGKGELEIGELIFWHSLQRIFETTPEELRRVDLLVVKEPGKARCVTKGLSYLKVVLDVVSKMCSYPLKKGIGSSKSGMSKESHGWEFFKSFFETTEGGPDLFNVKRRRIQRVGRNDLMIDEIYEDVFVSSTDYETATDFFDYTVAKIIGDGWMQKCGIPVVLRGIVMETCYKPREIRFHATGPLADLGDPTDTEGVRRIFTSRGVLMGDPLTKPCLHLVNVIARVIAENYSSEEFAALSKHRGE